MRGIGYILDRSQLNHVGWVIGLLCICATSTGISVLVCLLRIQWQYLVYGMEPHYSDNRFNFHNVTVVQLFLLYGYFCLFSYYIHFWVLKLQWRLKATVYVKSDMDTHTQLRFFSVVLFLICHTMCSGYAFFAEKGGGVTKAYYVLDLNDLLVIVNT